MTSADSPSLTSAQVVTTTEAGLSVYTAAHDTTRVLTTLGHEASVFRSSGTVTYPRTWKPADRNHLWGRDAIYQIPTAHRGQTQLLQLPNTVFAMAWNPDGSKLAYLVYREGKRARTLPTVLCLYTASSGKVKLLGVSAAAIEGREPGPFDEWSVAWSPDGSAIAVVDDPIRQMTWVVSQKGTLLVPPTQGTFARWLPDGRLLFDKGIWPHASWEALDVSTGQSTTVALPGKAARPAISPDGTSIAFTKLKGTVPSSFILRLATGMTTKLGAHLTTPIWLSPTVIALTRTTSCPTDLPCNMEPLLDKTVAVDVASLTRTKLQLLTTVLGSWSFYDGADVRLPD